MDRCESRAHKLICPRNEPLHKVLAVGSPSKIKRRLRAHASEYRIDTERVAICSHLGYPNCTYCKLLAQS